MSQEESKTSFVKKARVFYDTHYKPLLIIPFLLLILGIAQIGYQYSTTGDIMNKGISLKGGVILTVNQANDVNLIEKTLQDTFPDSDISVKSLGEEGIEQGVEVSIDINPKNAQEFSSFLSLMQKLFPTVDNIEENIQVITPQFGTSFFAALVRTLFIAFIFMSIVVFVYFRTPVPCLAVILAVVSDMIITLAVVNLLGLKISSGGIAAFLMLIGYSVDTDILLTTNVLKHKGGSVPDRVIKAAKTGIMLTVTAMVAAIVAIIASFYFTLPNEITQIMIIIAIGLFVDNINTWIQNVGILRIYMEKKHEVH